MTILEDQLIAWTQAERTGDAAALAALLHPEFVAVGPFGFLLDRDQWAQRFAEGLHYTAFEFVADVPARIAGGAAIVIGTQTQDGSHRSRPISGAFRVTLTFVAEPDWLLLGAHLSLRTPPDGRP